MKVFNATADPAACLQPASPVGRVPPHGVASPPNVVGRVPSHGTPGSPLPHPGASHDVPSHESTRIERAWPWQDGFHDHKLRTPESEAHKWEYVCLNPVRAGLVGRPEEWPFGGEISYHDATKPQLVRGTPPLTDTGVQVEDKPIE